MNRLCLCVRELWHTYIHAHAELKGFNRCSATKKQPLHYDCAVIYDTTAAAPTARVFVHVQTQHISQTRACERVLPWDDLAPRREKRANRAAALNRTAVCRNNEAVLVSNRPSPLCLPPVSWWAAGTSKKNQLDNRGIAAGIREKSQPKNKPRRLLILWLMTPR